jgi:hypothetical protein
MRHRWKYVEKFTLPRIRTPAICLRCGVQFYCHARHKLRPGDSRYGDKTEQEVFVLPSGAVTETRPMCESGA